VKLGIEASEFHPGFIIPENVVYHGLSIRCLLANSQVV
jgi:hypothetical protein